MEDLLTEEELLDPGEHLTGIVGQTRFQNDVRGIVVFGAIRETSEGFANRNLSIEAGVIVTLIRDFWNDQPTIDSDIVPEDAELVQLIFNGNYDIAVMSEEFQSVALSEIIPIGAEVFTTSPTPLGVNQMVLDESPQDETRGDEETVSVDPDPEATGLDSEDDEPADDDD